MPILQDATLPVRVIEMFAGACGGWKSSLNFIEKQCGIGFSTLALELNLEAAFAYSIGFGVPLTSGFSRVNPVLATLHRDLIVQTDIASDHWIELACAWKADVVTISSPCQPRSSAGSSSGIHSELGQLLFRALAI